MIPSKSDNTAFRMVDNEAVIIFLEKQENVVLNEKGSFIWQEIDGKKSLADIAQGLAGEFEVSHEDALRDSQEFLRDLSRRGAVVLKEC